MFLAFWRKSAFTLVEITIVIALFSIIVLYVFNSIIGIGIMRNTVMSKMELEENLHFFVEQLATTVKEWWQIDYEEYWNRQVVWTGTMSGHYSQPTGFGNYWSWWNIGNTTYGDWLYYCASIDSTTQRMWSWWCLQANGFYNTGTADLLWNQLWKPQRFGQYLRQYIDYNTPKWWTMTDNGDENSDGSAIGDNDDEVLSDWPWLDPEFLYSHELYLIERSTKERIFLRWNIRQDPNAPQGLTCNGISGSGCIWNIQMLRLVGKDFGYNHDGTSSGSYDGVIDTWVCHPNWENDCTWPRIMTNQFRLPSGTDDGWVNIFPDDVDVRNVSFSIAPLKNEQLAFDMDPNQIVYPYVRISLRVWYGWAKRRILKNIDPEISVNTLVSLTDYTISMWEWTEYDTTKVK